MKKCISILLAITLSINSGGFIIIFLHVQSNVKSAMLDSIRNGDIAAGNTIEFRIGRGELYKNVKGFIWKDTREFEYGGMMYDIIKMAGDKGEVVLLCINDKTEERIIKAFNDEVKDLASGRLNNSKYKTSLINLISQAVWTNPFQLALPPAMCKYNPYNFLNLTAIITEIPLPPPKHT